MSTKQQFTGNGNPVANAAKVIATAVALSGMIVLFAVESLVRAFRR